MFTYATSSFCAVETIVLLDSASVLIDSNNPLNGLFRVDNEGLWVDTNIYYMQLITNFKIKIQSHLVKKSATKDIEVDVGCYGEKVLNHSLKALPLNTKSTSFDGAIIKFFAPLVAAGDVTGDPNSYLTYIPLNFVFDWTSDVPTCGLGKISIFNDAAMTTLSTGSVTLDNNPSTKSALGMIYP